MLNGGVHEVFYQNGIVFDPRGLLHVTSNGYWTLDGLAAAELLDAAESGLFTTAQYNRFLQGWADPMVFPDMPMTP
jgi:hypothetical protein